MIQVGFDNYVSLEAVRAVGHPGPVPMTRLMSQAREKGLLVDFTAGRRCKAILILDSGQTDTLSVLIGSENIYEALKMA